MAQFNYIYIIYIFIYLYVYVCVCVPAWLCVILLFCFVLHKTRRMRKGNQKYVHYMQTRLHSANQKPKAQHTHNVVRAMVSYPRPRPPPPFPPSTPFHTDPELKQCVGTADSPNKVCRGALNFWCMAWTKWLKSHRKRVYRITHL